MSPERILFTVVSFLMIGGWILFFLSELGSFMHTLGIIFIFGGVIGLSLPLCFLSIWSFCLKINLFMKHKQ